MVYTERFIDKSSIICYNLHTLYKTTKTMQATENSPNLYHHEQVSAAQEVAYEGGLVLEQTHKGTVIDLYDQAGGQEFSDPLERNETFVQIVGFGADGREASVFLSRDAVVGQSMDADGSIKTHLEARLPSSPFAEPVAPIVIGESWESPLGRLDQVSVVRKELVGGPMGFEEHRSGESPFIRAHQVVRDELKPAVLHELSVLPDDETLSGEALLRIERNRALLATSEAGRSLLPVYEAALRADPRVAEIRILATSQHLGRARHDNTVELRLGDTHAVDGAFGSFLDRVPALRENLATQLSLNPHELTPYIARMQNMLHEFGHVLDYLDRGAALVSQQRAEEMEALPLGNVPASELLREDSSRRQELDQRYSPDEVAGLIAEQARAYRRTTAEAAADQFAAAVLRANPDLLKMTK